MADGFSMQITGLTELETAVTQLAANIKPTLIQQVGQIFEQGADRMRADCPVRTGFLKNSIAVNTSSSGNILAEINITAGYAGFVNFGTSRMSPRPFASNGYNFIVTAMHGITLRT